MHPVFASGELPSESPVSEDISLLVLARLLLRHWRVLFGAAIVICALVTVLTLLQSRTYTSTAVFMPQAAEENTISRLSGIAAQFGFRFPTEDAGSSAAFYANLLRSRNVLRDVVLTSYTVEVDGRSAPRTLVQLLRIDGDSPEARRDAAVRSIRKNIRVAIDRETGLVTLDVTTNRASLSAQVAQRMIQLVSAFNMQTRRTRAGAERRFVEERVGEARDSLRLAEDRLQAFLQRNRDYRNSPQLSFEFERLQRGVTMQQQLFTTLMQGYEQARIDEVRNTPVITLVEPPDRPTKPDPRYTLLKALVSFVAALLLGTFFVAMRHAMAGLPQAHRTSAEHSSPSSGEHVQYRRGAGPERGSPRIHGDSGA
jgi:uncharacterized protein involved in exopolysaccharide biosynthesis